MAHLIDQTLPLQDCTVLSLRPRGQHASLRAAAARLGARTLAISTLAITHLDDADTREKLSTALQSDGVLFTSPNAVKAAAALHPLRARREQYWVAVGEGTRLALQRHGIAALAPSRMDSEGLLGLPELTAVQGKRIGMITAPGGRGLLEPALRARGATVLRANVYQRQAAILTTAARHALIAALEQPVRCILALSSGEALQALLAQSPPTALRKVHVVAASARLAELARRSGFTHVATATSARPAALLQAAVAAR